MRSKLSRVSGTHSVVGELPAAVMMALAIASSFSVSTPIDQHRASRSLDGRTSSTFQYSILPEDILHDRYRSSWSPDFRCQ
jgi:hypothetical protein